jgi:CubicO group peptidase (beta-lactamase class C family)
MMKVFKRHIEHSDEAGFEQEVKNLLLYRKIVKAEKTDDQKAVLTLDDGTELILEGNEGCGGCGYGWFYVDEKYFQRGKLFPVGSFGHTGFMGASLFFSRAENMYVIMLTNATRFAKMKRNFQGSDYYNDTMKIRKDLHNAIFDDLKELGF